MSLNGWFEVIVVWTRLQMQAMAPGIDEISKRLDAIREKD